MPEHPKGPFVAVGETADRQCSYDRWGACDKPPLWRIWTIADGYDDGIERGLACAKHLNPLLQALTDHDEFLVERIEPPARRSGHAHG